MARYINILIIFLVSVFLIDGDTCVWAQPVSRVLARVNNEIITSKDFSEYLETLSYRLSGGETNFSSDDENCRKEALGRMIVDKLILDKAKKDKMEVPSAMIEEKFNQIVSAYSSMEEFEESLIEKGLNITSLKEKIKEQYLLRQMIDKYVKSKARVAPKEISQYYKEHIEEFSLPARYAIWIAKFKDYDFIKEIGHLIDREGIEKARQKYADLLVRMESREKDLIDQISGVLSQIRQGDYFIREVNSLYYLVFLESELPAGSVPLEEVKEKIYARILDKKVKENFLEWMKELREKAMVKIYP
ncbi:MAG: SurA N-terminal domain-containing protein [Candidatus Omnitrophota bacterium]|nr:MAG: SurA N-terminal domain-containing protein [Candidatus Omnitrophota bacterium]